jgi:hypothetical protein
MTKDDFKNIKIGDIIEVSGPRNKNKGKIGIVRAIEINNLGTGTVYLEPRDCEFAVGIVTQVLYTGVYLYGFTYHALSYKIDR